MKRTMATSGNMESDVFAPLRSLSSPVGVERIKMAVLGASQHVSLWRLFRGFFAEFLALTVMTAAAFNITPLTREAMAPVGVAVGHPVGNISREMNLIGSSAEVIPAETRVANIIPTEAPSRVTPSTAVAVVPIAESPVSFGCVSARTDEIAECAGSIVIAPSAIHENLPAISGSGSDFAFSSQLLGGSLFGRMRMLAEGISLNLAKDGYSFALEYVRANGRHSLQEELLHHPTDPKLLVGEERQQFSLMAGLVLPLLGPLEAHGSIGPSYLIFKTTSASSITKLAEAPSVLNRLGAQCEVEIDLPISSLFTAGLRGTAGYYGLSTGSVLLGLTITP